MKYEVIPGNKIRQLNDWHEPFDDSMKDAGLIAPFHHIQYLSAKKAFDEHIANLPTYPYSPSLKDWKIGEVKEEGKDFVWNWFDEEHNYEQTAIPLPNQKDNEDELWDEVLSLLQDCEREIWKYEDGSHGLKVNLPEMIKRIKLKLRYSIPPKKK